jgi:hypothetical protein
MDVVEEREAAPANTTRAAALGMCAFAAGIACAPDSDEVLTCTSVNRAVGDARTPMELMAWTQGWQRASNAPTKR